MARNGRTMANSYHCGLFARPAQHDLYTDSKQQLPFSEPTQSSAHVIYEWTLVQTTHIGFKICLQSHLNFLILQNKVSTILQDGKISKISYEIVEALEFK